jgi:hypothetical protein
MDSSRNIGNLQTTPRLCASYKGEKVAVLFQHAITSYVARYRIWLSRLS